MRHITMIVAMDKELAIGKNNDIPWAGRLRADMDHFINTTKNHVVVMGRKTYESIPEKYRPLPDRTNVILTRNTSYTMPGCIILHQVEEVLHLAEGREIFVMGGAEIYNIFLPYAKRIIATRVDTRVEGADTFFPLLSAEKWKFNRQMFMQTADARNCHNFTIIEYIRR